MAVAGCAGQTDHATHSAELADTWKRQDSAPILSAMSVKFTTELTFHMIASDGTPYDGTFEVDDPRVLMTPTIPPNTLWCIPRADFSGPNLDIVTFATFDPALCTDTPLGTARQSQLEGSYDVVKP